MMTALLLYSYCCGIYSSRRIAKACRERVDFMSIVALDAPDFRTVSDFRKRHLQGAWRSVQADFAAVREGRPGEARARRARWNQDQSQCVEAQGDELRAHGKARGGAGSRGRPNGSARPRRRTPRRTSCTAATRPARRCRIGSPTRSGVPRRSVRPRPSWRRRRRRRPKPSSKQRPRRQEKREAEGRRKPGPKAAPPSTEPDAKAQKNFTDPDSRIMKSKDGFVQAYNAQAAVDAEAQIIVAQDVTQSAVDSGQLVPMTDAIETNLGRKPEQLSADAGYCSEANLEALENRNIDGYVATGRARDAVAGTVKGEATAAHAVAGAGRRTDTRRGHAREDQGRRPREPLPAAQAAARAGVRADQTGPRLPSVPAARLRESARRVGHRLHRPQPPQAGPEVESVRSVADGRLSRLTGMLPRRRNNETASLA